MGRPSLTLAAALLIAAISTGTAIACSCVRYENARAQYAAVDILFFGRVISIQNRTNQHGYPVAVTRFAVARTIKGRPDSVRELEHSTLMGGMCGISFSKGQTYFVGAHIGADGRVGTSSCSQPRFPVEDFEKIAGGK